MKTKMLTCLFFSFIMHGQINAQNYEEQITNTFYALQKAWANADELHFQRQWKDDFYASKKKGIDNGQKLFREGLSKDFHLVPIAENLSSQDAYAIVSVELVSNKEQQIIETRSYLLELKPEIKIVCGGSIDKLEPLLKEFKD
ncbi:MAG: hypothetical protein MRY83_17035 [Flavobacteriales bacterium]|nr:hypothetical protein [Flavobacteriales bacterium]